MTEAPSRTVTRFNLASGLDPMALHQLLEHGDREDLSWLLTQVSGDELKRHVERFGDRLSRRSRELWELLLEVEAPAPTPLARALWPLT